MYRPRARYTTSALQLLKWFPCYRNGAAARTVRSSNVVSRKHQSWQVRESALDVDEERNSSSRWYGSERAQDDLLPDP